MTTGSKTQIQEYAERVFAVRERVAERRSRTRSGRPVTSLLTPKERADFDELEAKAREERTAVKQAFADAFYKAKAKPATKVVHPKRPPKEPYPSPIEVQRRRSRKISKVHGVSFLDDKPTGRATVLCGAPLPRQQSVLPKNVDCKACLRLMARATKNGKVPFAASRKPGAERMSRAAYRKATERMSRAAYRKAPERSVEEVLAPGMVAREKRIAKMLSKPVSKRKRKASTKAIFGTVHAKKDATKGHAKTRCGLLTNGCIVLANRVVDVNCKNCLRV